MTTNPPIFSLPGHTRELVVMILLGLNIAADVLLIVTGFFFIRNLRQSGDIEAIAEDDLNITEALFGFANLAQLLLLIVTGILFLVWLHRAFSNLAALGETHTEFSPGWAVGYFFIPFVNLVRPYQAVKELWLRSKPQAESDFMLRSADSTSTVLAWWLVWLASGVASNIAGRMFDRNEEPSLLVTATWVTMAASILSIAAAALALIVVKTIDARQRAKMDMQAAHPPQPSSDYTAPQL